MVFTSLPLYLDPPNWNQQQDYRSASSSGGSHLPPLPEVSVAAGTNLVRPGSMADRARLAGLPQPEQAVLKCPRCESTNTKFCYFNNYSLSQPRHFCKTCRRYWTRGGALRNVPVGGGCRRNKRSSKSKTSSAASANRQTGMPSSSAIPPDIRPPPAGEPPFMASLHSLGDYNSTISNLGLGFSGLHPIEPVDYQILGRSSSLGLEHRKMQQIEQFPLLTNPSMQGLYNFNGESSDDHHGLVGSILPMVKMENELQRLNLPREYLGIPRNNQYWGSGDLSGFNSSSSGNIL